MTDLKKRSLAMSNLGINRTDNNLNNKQTVKTNIGGDSAVLEFSSTSNNKETLDQQKGSKVNNEERKTSIANNKNTKTHSSTVGSTSITGAPTTGSKKLLSLIEKDKKDGTLSDSALTNPVTTSSTTETSNKKRRPSMAKALVILGLSKKSSSANNITYSKYSIFKNFEIILI